MTKYPRAALDPGYKVLRYLKAYPAVCWLYGVTEEESLVQGFSDASYAPESSRSHGAYLTMWGSAVVNWTSKRQAYMTTSTAEAELGSLHDAGLGAASLTPLIAEFLQGAATVSPEFLLTKGPAVTLFTDNSAAVAIVTLPGGSWRTRHLPIKAAWLKEQVSKGWGVEHMPGARLCADALTKALPKERFHMLLELCGLGNLPLRTLPGPLMGKYGEVMKRALAVLILAACIQSVEGEPTRQEEEEIAWVFWVIVGIAVVTVWELCKALLRRCRWGAPSGVSRDTNRGGSLPGSGESSRVREEPTCAGSDACADDVAFFVPAPGPASGSRGLYRGGWNRLRASAGSQLVVSRGMAWTNCPW